MVGLAVRGGGGARGGGAASPAEAVGAAVGWGAVWGRGTLIGKEEVVAHSLAQRRSFGGLIVQQLGDELKQLFVRL